MEVYGESPGWVCYSTIMAEAETKRFGLDEPPPVLEETDRETLAAIEQGVRDADAGRLVSSQEVRKLLPSWTPPAF